MGVTNLSKALKECGGQTETRFNNPGVMTHVDFLSRFFRLVQVRVFNIVQVRIKNGILTRTEIQNPDQPLETYNFNATNKRRILDEHKPPTTVPNRRAHLPYDPTLTLNQLIELSIQELDPTALYTHSDGLSTSPKEEDKLHYHAVAYVLDSVLSKILTKDQTVIHIDGRPSEQKRQEHRRRNSAVERSLLKLQEDAKKPNAKPTRSMLKRCKNAYRTSRSIMENEIFPVLITLGWTLHRCPYQADTCLAQVSQQTADPSLLIFITRDSDIIVYEGVDAITMPVGKAHELVTVSKKSLLSQLNLPSDKHLLLACLVTSNDYVRNIPYFGLLTNCEIVRSMDLSGLSPLGEVYNNKKRAEEIQPYIQQYIDIVNSRLLSQRTRSKSGKGRKQTTVDTGVDHYHHAITAFVERTESDIQDPVEPIDNTPPAHEIVVSILEQLYKAHHQQQQQQIVTTATITTTTTTNNGGPPASKQESGASMNAGFEDTSERDMDVSTFSTSFSSPSAPSMAIRPPGTPKRKKSLRQKERRITRQREHRKKRSKYKKWRSAKFKSRTDLDQRYSVRRIVVAEATRVDPTELAKMTPAPPRKKNPTNEPPSSTGPQSSSSSSSASSSSASAKPARKKAKKPRKTRKRKKPAPAQKASFAATFATSTQRLGSIQGCLRRALLPLSEAGMFPLYGSSDEETMNDDDFTILAKRLSDAVDTMNQASLVVYRMLEIIIWNELLRGSNGTAGGGQSEPDCVIEEVTLSGGKATVVSGSSEAGREDFDILDLLLQKSAGMALIKHLYALALNGKVDNRGPKTKKAASKAVKAIAQRAYARLLQIAPGYRPTNTHHIQLGRPIVAAAKQVIVSLRTHFQQVPYTIGARMLKNGWDKDSLPAGSFKEDRSSDEMVDPGADQDNTDLMDDADNDNDDDEEVEVEDEDPSTSFPTGHISHWWRQATLLPSSARPVFCLRRPFKSCFVMLEERALPQILWGTSQKFPNPAYPSALKIMAADKARRLVDEEYGRLVKLLFYGDRHKIRDSASVWQTTYGKRTATMNDLAHANNCVYGTASLEAFLTLKFEFLQYAKLCYDQGRPCDRSPPPLPTDPTTERYALSNMISTNGKQIHALCFDTTKSFRTRSSFAPIYRIERQFPTLQSILDAFGVDSVEEIDVWGIDPGEVNPAAFCRLERQGSTDIATNSSMEDILGRAEDVDNPILPPSVVANNLVVSRLAIYSPTIAHRNQLNAIKEHRPVLVPQQEMNGDLWSRADLDRDKTGTSLPSIKDIENLVRSSQYENQDDCETAIQRIIQVGPILQDFYASKRMQSLNWELRKSKDAEMDLAIDAVLRTCSRKTLFCYGNGKFKTGLNLASVHESFKGKFAQKAVAAGHVVVLVDEMLTSTMCPTCVELGVTSRLAKPTLRSCACLNCGRWLHRDIVGAHNLAIVGETWIRSLTRPGPLCRMRDSEPSTRNPTLHSSN